MAPWPLPKFGPLQSGYRHFWGFRGGAVDYYTHANKGPDLWDGDTAITQAGYLTDLLGDRAVKLVAEFATLNRPFLLSLHFSAPHWPWEAPGDTAESDRLAKRKDPDAIMDFDGGSRATYAAMVKRMDEQVGKVLAELDRQASPTTPSSSSPATMAASASPTPGPLPGARPSSLKAASASRRSCAGRGRLAPPARPTPRS